MLSETSQKFIESLVDDLSNSVSRLTTTSPLTSHSGVTAPKEIRTRNKHKSEVYRSLVSVMKLFESSEMNFGLGPLDAADRGATIPPGNNNNNNNNATGIAGGANVGQKSEARVRFMSPVAARRGSGSIPGGSVRGSQPGSVRSSRQSSVRGSVKGSILGSVRGSVPDSRQSRWSLESGNIDSLLLSSKYNNFNDVVSTSRGFDMPSQASPNSTGWRLGQTIPFTLCLRMMRDCVSGVSALHKHDIVHCDIKSLNFLVTKDFVVKLSDLGEARILPPKPDDGNGGVSRSSSQCSGSNNPSRAPSRSGSRHHPAIAQNMTGVYAIPVHTPLYPNTRTSSSTIDPHHDRVNNINISNSMNNNGTYEAALPRNINWSPPEVLAGNVMAADKSIDVWGLAMVLSELLLGEVPFDSDEFRQLSMYEFLGVLSDGARPCLNEKTAPNVPRADIEWIESMLADAWDYEARHRCTAAVMLEKIDAHLYRGRGTR